MWRFLVGLGGLTLLVGLLTIAFGSVIFVSTVGNALIAAGAVGFTGGGLIVAVALVLREVERLRLLVEVGGGLARSTAPAAPRRSFSEPAVSEAAMLAVSEAVAPEPMLRAIEPAAPEPVAPEPAAPAHVASAPVEPPAPTVAVDAPAPRRPGLSFADRLRPAPPPATSTPPSALAPRLDEEVPVAERRGRILSRPSESEAVPPAPRPRSLLDRMSLSRPAPERLVSDRPPEPVAPEPALEVPDAEPPAAEPAPPEAPAVDRPAARPYGAPAARPAPEPTVLKSGIVGGMAYTLYSDGSIQAELPDGVVRFASLMELREHVSRGNPPA